MPEKKKEIVIPEKQPALFPLEILEGQDTEIITTERKPDLFTLGMPQTENIALIRKQFLFIGEWDPSEDPLKIGEQNFSVLENYRYKDFGLEAVNGYTKINATTALATYLKGRSGIQLRTPYTIKSYVLIQGEKTDFSESAVKENRAAIPSQGDFEAGTLHVDASGAGLGRFSSYPQGHLAYCNEKESCIYAGVETRCAAFFTLFASKIVGSSNIDFNDNGASADTITDSGAGLITTAIFKAGHRITVEVSGLTIVAVATFIGSGLDDLTSGGTFSGSSITDYTVEIDLAAGTDTFKWSVDGGTTWEAEDVAITGGAQTLNNGVTVTFAATTNHTLGDYWSFKAPANAGDYTISSVAAGTITLQTGLLTVEANKSAVIGISIKRDHTKAMDYTEAINNEINSVAESVTITAATGNFGLVLSTRPLQGVKAYVRTANGTTSNTTWKYWDGDSFEAVSGYSDGTSVDNKSLAQTGTFSFDSTVSVAKPLHFEGLYLYAYLFELSAGSAVIYNVTLDAPFQDMVDVWDGVYRPPIHFNIARGLTVDASPDSGSDKIQISYTIGYPAGCCYLVPDTDYEKIEIGAEIVANAITATVLSKIGTPAYANAGYYAGSFALGLIEVSTDLGVRDLGATYTYANPDDAGGTADYKDFTLEVSTPSYADYPIGAVIDGLTAQHHMIIIFEERMSAIWFEMIADLVNTNSAVISAISHWKGDGWQSTGRLTDSSQGLPGNTGAGKSYNRSGLVSWLSPDEKDEFKQTLFGVNGYAYKITVDATLSGTEGGEAEVVIDTIKGIPAQRTIKGYKFPAHYRNRPMLCGFVDGKEGNRVDYGMANTTSVFNGEDSSFGSRGPLYFGGGEDLTAFCEIYNRFGSSIYTTGIFTKATETYILTGYDVTTWRIHQISSIIGCPASETMDTAEVGYDIGAEAVRNIAIWLAYMGPVIFDAGVLVPTIGEKIRCYFDKSDARCINFAAIDKSHGKVDPDNMEYDLWIPSGSGQTTCNVWLCLDLVRKKWFVKVPAGSDTYPQAAFRVMDDYGAEYVYGLRDNGRMMRLEHGQDWDGNAIAQKVATADLIPTGDMFDYTEIRRLKLVCISTTEDVDVTIKHYKDGAAGATTVLFTISIVGSSDITFSRTASPDTIVTAGGNFNTAGFKTGDQITVSGGTANDGVYANVTVSGDGLKFTLGENVLVQDENNTSATITTLRAFAAKATDRHTRAMQNVNLQGWSHRLEFSVSTSSETKGVRLLGWNMQFKIIREDT